MSDELGRLKAALAETYAIDRELGRGGMATVYLAEDLKHKRQVAVKVLRADLAAVLGAQRFLREVEVTASLQHPNILPLYDSGQVGDTLYYVMPYLEGESLRQRIDREKQLPVEETVEIVKAICAALQFAHERGVVHRDIKPENVLFQAGQAIVADFGIALALSQASQSRMTATGLSLGTTRYMSPEQVAGSSDLDARSDVYSLGAVTYEMLTGSTPHQGKTAQALLASIVTEVPSPISVTRSMVPANVDAAVQVALAKAPADRFATAERFAQALSDPEFRLPSARAPVHGAARSVGTWVWPGVAALLLVALAWVAFGTPDPTPKRVFRAALALPPGQALGSSEAVGIAPDGSFFVYSGTAADGEVLWLRRLDEAVARPIPGTEGGRAPRVSPDGRQVSFAVWGGGVGRLKVASLTDGVVRTLSDRLNLSNTAWNSDGEIYFRDLDGALWRVPSSGGEAERIAAPDSVRGELRFGWPDVLPGGDILVTVDGTGVMAVVDAETREVERIGVDGGVGVPGRTQTLSFTVTAESTY